MIFSHTISGGTRAIFLVKLDVVGENPELEDLDEEIEGVQKEEDKMKANLEELMTKLEALKTRRAAVAYE